MNVEYDLKVILDLNKGWLLECLIISKTLKIFFTN